MLRELQTAWTGVRAGMARMYGASSVEPKDYLQIFKVEDEECGQIKLDVSPVVLNVPERAGSGSLDLYVAIAGWLLFATRRNQGDPIRTERFGTKIGYFRAKRATLQHVYGAHYDIEETAPGHPVFHGQIAPQMEFSSDVLNLFHRGGEPENLVKPILRNVPCPDRADGCVLSDHPGLRRPPYVGRLCRGGAGGLQLAPKSLRLFHRRCKSANVPEQRTRNILLPVNPLVLGTTARQRRRPRAAR